MSRRRRKEREDYDPDYVPEEEEVAPSLSEPSEPDEPEEPSASTVIGESDPMAQAYAQYGKSRTTSKLEEEKAKVDLERQAREEERARAHKELIDSLKEKMASGKERVAKAKRAKLPDPDDFVGIPGPASKPRERSIRKAIQEKVDVSLQGMEETVIGFEREMYLAGRELGAEAQEAYEEGDYVEAFIKGTAAFSARAGVGIIDASTFLVRPLAWGKMGEALVLGVKDVVEHPEEVPSGVSKWAVNIAKDPGAIAQFAGDIAAGFAIGEVIKTIAGPKHVLTRVDDIDIDVKSTTLKMVDEVDPITGKTVKIAQFPEADVTSTISKRKIPKAMSEIMDTELDDLSGKGQILGVADEGGITVLDKIDLPEGAIDDLLEGTPVKVEGVIDTETVKIGSETFEYVDKITDPITGTKTTISRTGKVTPLDAKEIGVTMEIAEDASRLSQLALEGDELVTKPPPDIDFDTVKFKSVWDDTGKKGILEEGKRSYDVKGMVVESTEVIDDLIDDITPLEPTSGPKTPLSKTFGIGDDILQVSDETIISELTKGVKPVSKVIVEEAKGSPIVSAGIGVGASLASNLFVEETTTKTKVKTREKETFDTTISPLGLTSPLEDTMLVTETLEDELGLVDDVTPVIDIDIETPQKTIPIVIPKITPKPTPKPTPTPPITVTKTIPDVTPIFDVVDITIQDTAVTPVQKIIQKQDTILFPSLPLLPRSPLGMRPKRTRVPRKKKKRKSVKSPLIGFEFRSYKYRTSKELLGSGKVKNPFGGKKGKKEKLF